MIRRYKLGRDVELHKRTVERALLSLVGPGRATASVGTAEHDNVRDEIGGVPVTLVRTDVGVDIICDAERAGEVKAALGVPEVDEAVAEIVRVESGRPRYGVDLDDSVIPQEAGLNERAVNFEKGCYVGQETVARLFYRGKPNRHLRGLRLSEPVASGEPLRLGEREVGKVASSVVSPANGPIALAIVQARSSPRRHARGGRERRDGDRRRAAVHLGGIDAARAAPTSTQRSSAASSSTPSGSTSTKPVIALRPGRPNPCTCGSRSAASLSSGSIRTTSWSVRMTPTAMLPPIIQPRPPNILRSTTPGRASISSLTRAASSSSYAIAQLLSRGVISRPWPGRRACWLSRTSRRTLLSSSPRCSRARRPGR